MGTSASKISSSAEPLEYVFTFGSFSVSPKASIDACVRGASAVPRRNTLPSPWVVNATSTGGVSWPRAESSLTVPGSALDTAHGRLEPAEAATELSASCSCAAAPSVAKSTSAMRLRATHREISAGVARLATCGALFAFAHAAIGPACRSPSYVIGSPSPRRTNNKVG